MNNILYIVGLGPGDDKYLTLEAASLLTEHPLVLRTKNHPTVAYLRDKGTHFESFDDLYEGEKDFDTLYQKIAKTLIQKVKEEGAFVYAVPGSPMVAEKTVTTLLQEEKKHDDFCIKIIEGISFLDFMYTAFRLDPSDGVMLLDGMIFDVEDLNPTKDTFVTQVYHPLIAGEVKLKLMTLYADDHEIFVARHLGTKDQEVYAIKLYELDRLQDIDHLTSLYIPKADLLARNGYTMNDLNTIVEILRGEDGCPWDREQSLKSLLPQCLEEVYEYVDAVENEDAFNIEEELGDILLHVAMNSNIAKEEMGFSFVDVTTGICQKMIRRHPHVFGNMEVKDSEEVLANWDDIKKEEKQHKKASERMDDLPKAFPALLMAKKLQKRAASVGFDWTETEDVMAKLDEEIAEFKKSCEKNNQFEEIGDILFTIVNLSRFLAIDLEETLRYSNNKFKNRFRIMEDIIHEEGRDFKEMTLSEMDKYWDRAKAIYTQQQ